MTFQKLHRRASRRIYFNTPGADTGGGGGGAAAAVAPAATAPAADGGTGSGVPAVAASPTGGVVGGGAKVTVADDTVSGKVDIMNPPVQAADGQKPAGEQPAATAGDWMKDVPTELADNPALLQLAGKSVGDLAKSFVETKALVGKQSAQAIAQAFNSPEGAEALKTALATPEGKAEFEKTYRSTFVPADAKGYDLKLPELPESVKGTGLFNEEGLGKFGEVAHTLGLTKDQVDGLQKFDVERATTSMEANKGAMEHAAAERGKAFEAEFAKIHGANAPKVLDQAAALINKHGRESDTKEIASAPQAVRMAVANILANVSKAHIGEDTSSMRGGQPSGTSSPQSIQQQIRENMAKPAYRDEFHPEHKATIAHSQQLSRELAELNKSGVK